MVKIQKNKLLLYILKRGDDTELAEQGLAPGALQACELMKSLAHPARLMLLCALVEGERCVADLEALTGVCQPTLSQQLGILRERGLVAWRREGKFVWYSLASEEAKAVMDVLHRLYCQSTTGKASADG